MCYFFPIFQFSIASNFFKKILKKNLSYPVRYSYAWLFFSKTCSKANSKTKEKRIDNKIWSNFCKVFLFKIRAILYPRKRN